MPPENQENQVENSSENYIDSEKAGSIDDFFATDKAAAKWNGYRINTIDGYLEDLNKKLEGDFNSAKRLIEANYGAMRDEARPAAIEAFNKKLEIKGVNNAQAVEMVKDAGGEFIEQAKSELNTIAASNDNHLKLAVKIKDFIDGMQIKKYSS